MLLPGSPASGFPARAGVAEALLGRWDGALDRFEAAEALDRAERFFRAEALLRLGQPADALTAFRELSRSGGPYSGLALERAVSTLFEAGRYGEVVEFVESADADRLQDEARLRYEAGQSCYFTNRSDEAIEQLGRVTAGPYLPYALHTMAQIRHSRGEIREAVEILGRAIAATANDPDPVLASALADRLRLTRGRMIYQAAAESTGLPSEDRTRLLELALSQFSRIAPQGPLRAEALRGLGWCNFELGVAARALADFEAAAERDPAGRHEDLWAQGRVYQKLGYFDEAARFYSEARREALAQADRLTDAEPAGSPPAAGTDALQTSRARLEGLAGALGEISAALDRRLRAFLSVGERLEQKRGRAAALTTELGAMGRGLDAYLDTISASGLFQKADRPRLERLLYTQERVLREADALVIVFQRLGESSLWSGATPSQRARGEFLDRRLDKARASLSRAQLALLEGLRGRVPGRERELRDSIDSLKVAVSDHDLAFESARSALGRERKRTETLSARWKAASERREDLDGRLQELESAWKRTVAEESRRSARESARALRLRADTYALDETEALHLWEEKAMTRGRGVQP